MDTDHPASALASTATSPTASAPDASELPSPLFPQIPMPFSQHTDASALIEKHFFSQLGRFCQEGPGVVLKKPATLRQTSHGVNAGIIFFLTNLGLLGFIFFSRLLVAANASGEYPPRGRFG